MNQFPAEKIRNIAFIGHSGEGKTSIAECILFNAKATDRRGRVPDGTTVMDYDEQEIQRGISVATSMAYAVWKDVKLNLLDVPGFPDFEGEETEAMRGADSALIVTSACGSLTVGTEKALKYCILNRVPAMLFINGTDKENADYLGTLEAIREKFPRRPAPIHLPIMDGNRMAGYVNVLYDKAYLFSENGPQETPVPAAMKDELATVRGHLMEVAAENDEELLEKFFADGTLSQEDMVKGVRAGIASNSAVPVLGGSAECNKGIFNLMDLLVQVMPAPDEKTVLTEEKKELSASPSDKLAATVFKTVVDPFVGRLNYVKVLSGTLKTGMTVLNADKDAEERIAALYCIRGKKQEPVTELLAGDIGAIAKLAVTGTGDTLASPGSPVTLPPMRFPQPVFSMAVYAEKQGDEDKIFQGLYKLMDEDPTIHVSKNAETGEAILAGLGETHLDVVVKKLKSKFKVNAVLKEPRIPYRETVRKIAESEGKHKKQSGGHGQYGHVKMRFEPYDGDFLFDEEVVGGSVPKTYIPAVEKGIRECIGKGVLAGYPVIGLKAVLTDGSYHDVDSSELAFKIAASLAYKEGLKNAAPVLLEPVYATEITVPGAFTGDVMGDLNKRRGRILGMDTVGEEQVIHAEAPLAEMLRYATDLRSMTQGRGSYTMSFVRYEDVPPIIADKIVKAAEKE